MSKYHKVLKRSNNLKHINYIIETVTRLSNFNTDTDKIIKLIGSLDTNNAHGCDGILIHISKLWATSI